MLRVLQDDDKKTRTKDPKPNQKLLARMTRSRKENIVKQRKISEREKYYRIKEKGKKRERESRYGFVSFRAEGHHQWRLTLGNLISFGG